MMTGTAPRARRHRRPLGDLLGGALLWSLAAFSLLLLVGPSLVVIGISFTEKQYISFPPEGFTLRWYVEILDKRQLIDSIVVSLRIALWVMIACLALGVPAAFSLTRGRYAGRTGLSAFMVAPQMMPGMVIGIAILFFGSYFAFRQSDTMVIIGLTVFCFPFVVRVVMARLAGIDPALEEASANLGAGRAQTFLRVSLPQLTPAVLAGAAFAFIEAFDNITVALFTASPRSRPLAVLLALLVVFVIGRTIGLERIRT